MIEIKLRYRDSNYRWKYKKFVKKEDTPICIGDISSIVAKATELAGTAGAPEITYTIKFNKYVGIVSGMGGTWIRMIDKDRANRIISRTVDEVNRTVISNMKSLAIV